MQAYLRAARRRSSIHRKASPTSVPSSSAANPKTRVSRRKVAILTTALRADHVGSMNTPNGPRTQAIGDATYRNDLIRRLTDWAGLCWLLFVGLTVFLLCLPFMHFIYWLGDEGVLLHGAERLLRGRGSISIFLKFLPPGGFVIMAAWFGITGISIWSARLLAILTITGIACFTYLACRQASKHELSSALVAIGWAVMSPGLLTQINHHWFTTLFSMVAAWAVLASVEKSPRQWYPLIAGVAAGAAAMVTPTQGALTMLAAATSFVESYRQRTKLIAYVLGSALIPICLLAYVIAQGALAAACDDVILFTAERYASIQSVPYGFRGPQNRPLIYLFPIVALLTLITCARDWRTVLSRPLISIMRRLWPRGFHRMFPASGYSSHRLCDAFGLPLARILHAPNRRIVASEVPLCACRACNRSWYSSRRCIFFCCHTALHEELVATPRGGVTFWRQRNAGANGRIAATPSSDRYFFYPYMPMLPFLTAREHVSKYDIFIPGYTTPSQYHEACISAMRRASWLVIDRDWTDPNYLRVIFPAIRNAEPPEKKKFELALQSGFEFVARDGAYELRRRVKTVDETVCAGIVE